MKSFSDLFLNIRVRTGQRRNFFYQCSFPYISIFVSDYEELLVANESDINPWRWSSVIVMSNDILQASAGACCVCVPDEAWLDAGQMTDVTCCIVFSLLTSNLMSKNVHK